MLDMATYLLILDSLPYSEITLVDKEFQALPGEKQRPLCSVSKEIRTGRVQRLWLADETNPQMPYRVDSDCLLIAYYSSAEWGCHEVLGWPQPKNVLDLFCEFRCLTNGRPVPAGNGLLGACAFFGLDAMEAERKNIMRDLAMRGGNYSADEREQLLNYCQEDVLTTERLFFAMLPSICEGRLLSC